MLSLPDSWDLYHSKLKKKFRSNLRSASNRLQKKFGEENISFKEIVVSESNFEKIIDYWKIVDGQSWQGMAKISVASNPSKIEFLKKLIK